MPRGAITPASLPLDEVEDGAKHWAEFNLSLTALNVFSRLHYSQIRYKYYYVCFISMGLTFTFAVVAVVLLAAGRRRTHVLRDASPVRHHLARHRRGRRREEQLKGGEESLRVARVGVVGVLYIHSRVGHHSDSQRGRSEMPL